MFNCWYCKEKGCIWVVSKFVCGGCLAESPELNAEMLAAAYDKIERDRKWMEESH